MNKKTLLAGVRSYGEPGQGGRMAAGWAAALEARGIRVRWINAYESNALEAISECDILFCTINQDSPKDLRHLGSMLEVAERTGCKVYPDYDSRWYFDDKVSQAWLFQALGIPAPRTWVFFEKDTALGFTRSATFPLVFKLAAGAGSQNVRLVEDQRDAVKIIGRMFGGGIAIYPFAPRLKKAVKKNSLRSVSLADVPRLLSIFRRLVSRSLSTASRDRGYVLFQEMIPDNDCDYRVTVIGDRAFTFKRGVGDNDFRASGSGRISYPESNEIDLDLVRLAFDIQQKLLGGCIAMDFVRDFADKTYKLLEVSPSFVPDAVQGCKGHFTRDLTWVPGQVSPQECMVDDVLNGLSR